jgi:hypothetical protein
MTNQPDETRGAVEEDIDLDDSTGMSNVLSFCFLQNVNPSQTIVGLSKYLNYFRYPAYEAFFYPVYTARFPYLLMLVKTGPVPIFYLVFQ